MTSLFLHLQSSRFSNAELEQTAVRGIASDISEKPCDKEHQWSIKLNRIRRLKFFLAFTLSNIKFWQLSFWSGVTAIASGIAWMRGRWRIAWLSTVLFFVLANVSAIFEPPR